MVADFLRYSEPHQAPPQYPPPSLEARAERRPTIPAEAACHGEGAEPLRAEMGPDEA